MATMRRLAVGIQVLLTARGPPARSRSLRRRYYPSHMRSRRRAMPIFLSLLVLTVLVAATRSYWHGAAFVVQAAGMQGPLRTLASWDTTTVSATAVHTIPWRGGTLRSR